MKLTMKILCALFITVTVSEIPSGVSQAHTAPGKKVSTPYITRERRLQALNQAAFVTKAKVTAQSVLEENKESAEMEGSIKTYDGLLKQLNLKISHNEHQLSTMRQQLKKINQDIAQNTFALAKAHQNVAKMVRVVYEGGQVSYLSVLFHATSLSDFMSRFQSLQTIEHYETQQLQRVAVLSERLRGQKQERAQQITKLHAETKADKSLKTMDLSIQAEQKAMLLNVNKQLKTNSTKLARLETQLAPPEIAELKKQIAQIDAILSSNVPNVSVASLRYQYISPIILYDYVKMKGSTFSLKNIDTICTAAKAYSVNPVLMIAITGQEQAFVPADVDAAKIRNNPFNVFYSWKVYNTNLEDSANIAADTLRHKLSVPPPIGENPILWINDPANPWGIYATDPHWAYGVDKLYISIMKYVQASSHSHRLA